MHLTPLLQFEWRRIQRRRSSFNSVKAVNYIGVGLTIVFIVFDLIFNFADAGNDLFVTLLIASALLLNLAGMGIAARLTKDRQTGMLGLLLLTRTKINEFFLARATFHTLFYLYAALALLPCFGVAFLYGGVSFDRWIGVILLYPTAAAFCCACGFVGPMLSTNPAEAESISAFAKYALSGWTIALNYVATMATGLPLPGWLLSLGGMHGLLQLFRGFNSQAQFLDFLETIGVTWVESLLLVLIGGAVLTNRWRHNESYTAKLATGSFGERTIARWRKSIRPILETRPLVWLAALDCRHVWRAWWQCCAIVLIWLAAFITWRRDWLFPLSLYATAALLLGSVRMAMQARARSRAAALKQGEWDELHVSGVNASDLATDELEGLYLQFATISRVVRFVVIGLLTVPLFTRAWTPGSMFTHLATSIALLWWSMARPSASLLRAMLAVLDPKRLANTTEKLGSWGDQTARVIGFQILFQMGGRLNKSRYFPIGSTGEIVWGAILLVAVAMRAAARRRLTNAFSFQIQKYFEDLREPS